MSYEQRDNSGLLFKNDRQREGRNDPGYTGSALVDGKDYWISAWVKEGRVKKFFSLSFKAKTAAPQSAQEPPEREPEQQEQVPF